MALTCYLVISLRILRTIPLLVLVLMELIVSHFDIPNVKIPKTYLQINIQHELPVLVHPRTGHGSPDGE
jgi:hypothetical protein